MRQLYAELFLAARARAHPVRGQGRAHLDAGLQHETIFFPPEHADAG